MCFVENYYNFKFHDVQATAVGISVSFSLDLPVFIKPLVFNRLFPGGGGKNVNRLFVW